MPRFTTLSAESSPQLLFLSEAQVAELITIHQVMPLVEEAFIADGKSLIETFPVISYGIPSASGGWVIKSGAIRATENSTKPMVLGLKVGAYWAHNEASGLQNHNATIMLVDADTGLVSTILGANVITSLRTAAAGAVSSKWLAKPNPKRIAIIGAGDQARAQLAAHLCMFPSLTELTMWNRNESRAIRFAADWAGQGPGIHVSPTVEDAVKMADIIVTSTPSKRALVFNGWIKPGAHICAVGSDAPGKQEIETRLVMECSVFVDKRSQTATIGEMQHPLQEGLATMDHVKAELSEVCAGARPGRQSDNEITLFDSSGVSFQDLIVAEHVRKQAIVHSLGSTLNR